MTAGDLILGDSAPQEGDGGEDVNTSLGDRDYDVLRQASTVMYEKALVVQSEEASQQLVRLAEKVTALRVRLYSGLYRAGYDEGWRDAQASARLASRLSSSLRPETSRGNAESAAKCPYFGWAWCEEHGAFHIPNPWTVKDESATRCKHCGHPWAALDGGDLDDDPPLTLVCDKCNRPWDSGLTGGTDVVSASAAISTPPEPRTEQGE